MSTTTVLLKVLQDFWVRQTLPGGVGVMVGLSGGGDSVALLYLLLKLAPLFSLRIQAAHLDHGIRAESGLDVDFVRQLCREWQIPLVIERLDVPRWAGQHGIGLEEAGRELRQQFLQRSAEAEDCSYIALGHHRGDQAETLLMRLVRGSGLTGLASMRPVKGSVIRPLLDVSRAQLEECLAETGQSFIRDPSNEDLYFTRNRLRHCVVPELKALNPRLEENLAALSQRIALEEQYWEQEVESIFTRLGILENGELWFERTALLSLHPALRARVLRRALQEVRGDLKGLGAVHIEALENLLGGARPQGEVHLPAAWVGRRYQRFWFRAVAPPPPEPYDIEIDGPGEVRLPDGRRLLVSLEALPQGETPQAVEFPAQAVPFPLRVRSFRPGDRFHPRGAPGHRKLKKIFIDARIEREQRYRLPLLEKGRILWLVGLCRSNDWPCEKGQGPVLRVVLEPC